MTQKQRCPTCRSKKFQARAGGEFLCMGCGGIYDSDPNEGGDYHADPSRRLQLQERPQRDRSKLKGGLGSARPR